MSVVRRVSVRPNEEILETCFDGMENHIIAFSPWIKVKWPNGLCEHFLKSNRWKSVSQCLMPCWSTYITFEHQVRIKISHHDERGDLISFLEKAFLFKTFSKKWIDCPSADRNTFLKSFSGHFSKMIKPVPVIMKTMVSTTAMLLRQRAMWLRVS